MAAPILTAMYCCKVALLLVRSFTRLVCFALDDGPGMCDGGPMLLRPMQQFLGRAHTGQALRAAPSQRQRHEVFRGLGQVQIIPPATQEPTQGLVKLLDLGASHGDLTTTVPVMKLWIAQW